MKKVVACVGKISVFDLIFFKSTFFDCEGLMMNDGYRNL